MIPGYIEFWLRRASVEALRSAKAKELSKLSLLACMPLVLAIDDELNKRCMASHEFWPMVDDAGGGP